MSEIPQSFIDSYIRQSPRTHTGSTTTGSGSGIWIGPVRLRIGGVAVAARRREGRENPRKLNLGWFVCVDICRFPDPNNYTYSTTITHTLSLLALSFSLSLLVAALKSAITTAAEGAKIKGQEKEATLIPNRQICFLGWVVFILSVLAVKVLAAPFFSAGGHRAGLSSFRRVRSVFCGASCQCWWWLEDSHGIPVQFCRVEIDASSMLPGTIQSPCGGGEDIFFDSMEPAKISSEFALEDAGVSEFTNWIQVNAIWTDELKSISERRKRFMNQMGLNEMETGLHLILDNSEIREENCQRSPDPLGSERMTKNNGTELDHLSTSNGNDCCEWNSDRTIRDLDSGKKFLVHEFGQDGLPSFLKEVGSDRLMTLQEFENYLGISFSVQMFVHGENNIVGNGRNAEEEEDSGLANIEPKSSSWWKLFAIKSARKSTKVPRTVRTRVQYNWKRCVEFTAVYQGQEIQGHEGFINAMKFSPDGRYLATGGEDKIVRVWSVDEVSASCNNLVLGSSSFWMDKPKVCKIEDERKCSHSTPVIIPKRIFKLGNKPVQELYGHTNDILDISWSKYNCLLTASKDKTARIWQVGCDECMQIFQHNDYVTCIQFDPTDDGYFITGSIDGKIRKWGVSERRVIEWTDVRDIVTAISYRPNGQGFVVGTIAGSCHFYTSSGNNPLLGKQLFIQGKKKSAGKMITGFQFVPDDPEKVMITSADSKIRIVDGADVIQKYRGPRKSKRQLFASFTEDGRHIISVGDDSSIYIWNCKKPNPASSSSKNLKSIRSCEHFFSKDVSVALAWPGIDRKLRSISSAHKSEYYKKRESSILRYLHRFLVHGWLFGESLSRGSMSTWPEEKLTQWPEYTRDSEELLTLASPYTNWSRVIVAADISGSIRVYHNYGLPLRL